MQSSTIKWALDKLSIHNRVQKLNEFDEHKIPRGFNMYMLHALKMYKSLIKCSDWPTV